MKNEDLHLKRKRLVLKRKLENGTIIKRYVGKNQSNSEELELKSVELYEPYSYEQLLQINKKKYRDLKINTLINHLYDGINAIYKAIDLYKELKNRTEFWEGKDTYDFNFEDWNTIKKVNGKITKYLKELLTIKNKLLKLK